MRRFLRAIACLLATTQPATLPAQILEFTSSGLTYQVLTRGQLTLMYAHIPLSVREYAVIQVAFHNGSGETWPVKPTDFYFEKADGTRVRAMTESEVITRLYRGAGRTEVTELQAAYEKALYGNQQLRDVSTVYEKRRQLAMGRGHPGVRAAAAAAAIVLAEAKIGPGGALDGAVFFPTGGAGLGTGRLSATIRGQRFLFNQQNVTRLASR